MENYFIIGAAILFLLVLIRCLAILTRNLRNIKRR